MRRPIPAPWKVGFLILFLAIAGIIAFVTYDRVYTFILSFNLAQLPGVAILDTPTPGSMVDGTPASSPIPTQASGPPPDPWDGGSRVTILVMGLDYRDWETGDGPPRTDTMILLTIDPLTMTAGMLNIPRDLWVSIPGYGYGKINTAYPLGEAFQVPPYGGPTQAMLTVEALLGIDINYYAQVDFYAFEQFINELGGIYIDVPAEITVDPLGEHNTVILQPGRQLLDGSIALAYARARSTEGVDFDRSQRQQQVILAMLDRALELGPAQLAARAPALYDQLSAGVHTNLSLDDALRLGWLAIDVPRESIARGAIAANQVIMNVKSPDGAQDILIPLPDQIRLVRDQIFASSGMASPILNSGDPRANMETEAAAISVLNGSSVEGLAARTQTYLNDQGANVLSTGNNDYTTYTRIIDYTGNPYTMRYLVDLMSITRYSIIFAYNPASTVDVAVILGDDWAGNNPLP
jgi:LCP family protein required for cell wall assembly